MVNVRKRLNLNHIVLDKKSLGLDHGNALQGHAHVTKGRNHGNALHGQAHVTKGHNRGNALHGHPHKHHHHHRRHGNALVGDPLSMIGAEMLEIINAMGSHGNALGDSSWGGYGGSAWDIAGQVAEDAFDFFLGSDDEAGFSYNYPDPALAFNFGLKIGDEVEALFTECTGLKIKRKPFMYKEGGYNDFVHKLIDRTEYDDVKLKRGITASDALWEWYLEGIETDTVKLQNITIMLLKPTGEVLKRWNLMDAFPIEWSGPDLKTDSNNVAFETITLTYHRLTTDTGD
jgi:phage tail-like protein